MPYSHSKFNQAIAKLTEPSHGTVSPTQYSNIFSVQANSHIKAADSKKRALVVLTGPSRAGKDTIMANLLGRYNKFTRVPTATSRTRREDEPEGAKVWMPPPSRMESHEEYTARMIVEYDLIEHEEHNSALYGLPRRSLTSVPHEQVPVIDTNPSGIRTLTRALDSDFVLVSFLVCPESGEQIQARMDKLGTNVDERMEEGLRYLQEGISVANYTIFNCSVPNFSRHLDNIADGINGLVD